MIPLDHIAINLAQKQACAIVDSRRIRCYSVAIGKPSTPTPKGIFYVKAISPKSKYSHIYGDFLGPWLIDLGTIPNRPNFTLGIHGTNSPEAISTAISGGCIRLRNSDIQDLITSYLFNKVIIK